MNVLGFDTATPDTAVAALTDAGELHEARDAVSPGERGHHAERLLTLTREVLERARLDWAELGLVAVGVGPGGYTGLRIGLATARGLALARAMPLSGVATLRALAEPLAGQTALTLIDARRGELFAAAYRDDVEVLAPTVIAPAQLANVLPRERPLLAVGDGACQQRAALERLGATVPDPDSPLHHVSGGATCRLAARGERVSVKPLYLRRPDAERALAGTQR